MCGIAGYFIPYGLSPETPNLASMNRVQRHRGPDGEANYLSKDYRFQASFVRLAIIDLENSDQPISDPKNNRILLGNGEIYNFIEIRKSALCMDYSFSTHGDMETVLALYAAIGPKYVNELNGMYALALYDEANHNLELVRDRMGIKPLYWAKTPRGGVTFASEVKTLFASGLITPRIDETAVTSYLRHGYVPGPQTIYVGVQKVMPGERIRFGFNGSIKRDQYWTTSPEVCRTSQVNETCELLSELLEDSVRMQLRADVPFGVLLSGGIDSGLLAAFASKHSSKPVKTYTVKFEGAQFDETPLANKVSEYFDTDHTVINIPKSNIVDSLPELAWFCDEPQNDPALLPNARIEEALGKEVKVALNGTGGDELFAGYGRYFQRPIEYHYSLIPSALRRSVIEPFIGKFSPMMAFRLARTELWNGDPGRYLHDHSTLFPNPILKLIGHDPRMDQAAQSSYANTKDLPHQTRLLIADINTYLVDNLLTLLDRTSMAYGVEGRVPFLDHRLVKAALSIPPQLRTPGGQQKGLERAVASKILPAEIVGSPKRGFAAPVSAWVTAGFGPIAFQFLTRPRALERGWWTKDGISALARNPVRHGFRLYSLFMLELSVYLHVDQRYETKPDISFKSLSDVT